MERPNHPQVQGKICRGLTKERACISWDHTFRSRGEGQQYLSSLVQLALQLAQEQRAQ